MTDYAQQHEQIRNEIRRLEQEIRDRDEVIDSIAAFLHAALQVIARAQDADLAAEVER